MQEFTIRDVTRITGLSRTTILYYESKGLITPHFADQSDHRLYFLSDISKILFFQNLKNLGISVQEYAAILDGGSFEGSDIYQLILSKKTAFVKRTLALMNMWDETLALTYHLRAKETFRQFMYSRDMWVLPMDGPKTSAEVLAHWDDYFLTRNLCYIFPEPDADKPFIPWLHGIACFDENALSPPPEIRETLLFLPSCFCMTCVVPYDINTESFENILFEIRLQAEHDGYALAGAPWAHSGYRDDRLPQSLDYLTIYQPVKKKN